MKNEERITRYDERLLRNERSWRRARIGAIFFSVLSFIAFLFARKDDLIAGDSLSEELVVSVIWILFWLLIIDWLTLRLRHIDSINFYRHKYSGKEGSIEQ